MEGGPAGRIAAQQGVDDLGQRTAAGQVRRILVGDGTPGDHWGGTMQSQGDELGKDEGSLNTLRGVGKRVAEIALRMAGSAK